MADRKHTVEFCGVKLVRFGSRPRRAVKVQMRQYTLAILPNGSVACSADSPFERFRNNSDPWSEHYVNTNLADQLLELGAITAAAHREHRKQCDALKEKRTRRKAARELIDNAETAKVRLSRHQRTELRALITPA